jgi:hypothetical protein
VSKNDLARRARSARSVIRCRSVDSGRNEIGWDEIGWDEIGWDEIGWDEIGWDEIGWDEIGWDDSGWDENKMRVSLASGHEVKKLGE